MTKSNMLGKIVCCYLKQFIGFLKQKDPINFWTIFGTALWSFSKLSKQEDSAMFKTPHSRCFSLISSKN